MRDSRLPLDETIRCFFTPCGLAVKVEQTNPFAKWSLKSDRFPYIVHRGMITTLVPMTGPNEPIPLGLTKDVRHVGGDRVAHSPAHGDSHDIQQRCGG